MEKSFFRRWFSSSAPTPVQETTEALAQRGDAEAQFNLALGYASGMGAAQDYALAEHWYLKAADQQHALANFNLGIMYANGQGTPPDHAKSLVWTQKAADLGDAGAQYSLGMSHHRSVLEGLSENAVVSRIEAFKWFSLAAIQGYLGADKACTLVNLGMSREDVMEGSRRVAAFNVEFHPNQGAQDGSAVFIE